jgi:hypothetical protein
VAPRSLPNLCIETVTVVRVFKFSESLSMTRIAAAGISEGLSHGTVVFSAKWTFFLHHPAPGKVSPVCSYLIWRRMYRNYRYLFVVVFDRLAHLFGPNRQ